MDKIEQRKRKIAIARAVTTSAYSIMESFGRLSIQSERFKLLNEMMYSEMEKDKPSKKVLKAIRKKMEEQIIE